MEIELDVAEMKPEVVRKSISLSKAVSNWADGLAHAKGFGTNFSAYIADLIRKDKEREIHVHAHGKTADQVKSLEISSTKEIAASAIAAVVQKTARKGRTLRRTQ